MKIEDEIERILDEAVDPFSGSSCCYSDHIGKWTAAADITKFIEDNFVPKTPS